MGDAGPITPLPVRGQDDAPYLNSLSATQSPREVNVLVTGFGPFKSFTTNPSSLIASALPTSIDPSSQHRLLQDISASSTHRPIVPANSQPYQIKIHTHPSPVRVAYASTSTFVPRLIGWTRSSLHPMKESYLTNAADHLHSDQVPMRTDYDYVFHMGMAGGRDSYALETIAHRDHYKIKDVDDRDGFMAGEYVWKQENLPEYLEVGWDKSQVLTRWEKLTERAEEDFEEAQMHNMGFGRDQLGGAYQQDMHDKYRSISMVGKGRRAVVKLSSEAGRFLCEFILYTSLSTRWKEAKAFMIKSGAAGNEETNTGSTATSSAQIHQVNDTPTERIGKVAFLHVPGGTSEHDIARGVRVAEAAILAVVSSWEDGYRNQDVCIRS